MYIRNGSDKLVLANNLIFAGRGGDGGHGEAGAPGVEGGQGAPGINARECNSESCNGETQPGATCGANWTGRDLKIELDGQNAGSVNGLTVSFADDTMIRGLVINRFHGPHVFVTGANDVKIQCNQIGTSVDGMTGLSGGGSGSGVSFAGGTNQDDGVIGTDGDGVADASEWNLVSGNSGNGIALQTCFKKT